MLARGLFQVVLHLVADLQLLNVGDLLLIAIHDRLLSCRAGILDAPVQQELAVKLAAHALQIFLVAFLCLRILAVSCRGRSGHRLQRRPAAAGGVLLQGPLQLRAGLVALVRRPLGLCLLHPTLQVQLLLLRCDIDIPLRKFQRGHTLGVALVEQAQRMVQLLLACSKSVRDAGLEVIHLRLHVVKKAVRHFPRKVSQEQVVQGLRNCLQLRCGGIP
mmetsp:Transcript_134629/g.319116  ORF Transcript_134629/g.319116 Transcript_134629/m.319116 type:complete len:217 (+) Transcript_134629:455-1105(+)